jgi:hypothetical protein
MATRVTISEHAVPGGGLLKCSINLPPPPQMNGIHLLGKWALAADAQGAAVHPVYTNIMPGLAWVDPSIVPSTGTRQWVQIIKVQSIQPVPPMGLVSQAGPADAGSTGKRKNSPCARMAAPSKCSKSNEEYDSAATESD